MVVISYRFHDVRFHLSGSSSSACSAFSHVAIFQEHRFAAPPKRELISGSHTVAKTENTAFWHRRGGG
jgi:hypothetical protein